MLARFALLAALLASAPACEPSAPSVGGARNFAEIDASAAEHSLGEDAARLVQVRADGSLDPRVPRAAIVSPDDPVPEAWLHESRPIVVIAGDPVAARRLAARLLRLGAARVSVVRGGIEAWAGPREEPAAPGDRVGLSGPRGATPTGREPARRMDSWQQSQK